MRISRLGGSRFEIQEQSHPVEVTEFPQLGRVSVSLLPGLRVPREASNQAALSSLLSEKLAPPRPVV